MGGEGFGWRAGLTLSRRRGCTCWACQSPAWASGSGHCHPWRRCPWAACSCPRRSSPAGACAHSRRARGNWSGCRRRPGRALRGADPEQGKKGKETGEQNGGGQTPAERKTKVQLALRTTSIPSASTRQTQLELRGVHRSVTSDKDMWTYTDRNTQLHACIGGALVETAWFCYHETGQNARRKEGGNDGVYRHCGREPLDFFEITTRSKSGSVGLLFTSMPDKQTRLKSVSFPNRTEKSMPWMH